jgi:hypothetical protein
MSLPILRALKNLPNERQCRTEEAVLHNKPKLQL